VGFAVLQRKRPLFGWGRSDERVGTSFRSDRRARDCRRHGGRDRCRYSGSAARLDVLNYAFANVAPDADGNVVCKLADEWADYQVPWTADQSVTGEAVTWPPPILGNFQQLQALKTLYPSLKVVISLGGWTFSKYFSDAALTDA
jgi:Glycosyl hydrolases family 18